MKINTSFPELLNLLENLEVMKSHEIFGTELPSSTIINIHESRRQTLDRVLSWFITPRFQETIKCTVANSSSQFADLFKKEWIDDLEKPFIEYMLSIYQYEIGRFYECEYPYVNNKQMLDADIATFKLSCNIPTEYVYSIMCMDSFIEFLIKRATDDPNMINHFRKVITSLGNIDIQYSGTQSIDAIAILVGNILRMDSIKTRIREVIIDDILSNNKYAIIDTSPVWVYMSVHG